MKKINLIFFFLFIVSLFVYILESSLITQNIFSIKDLEKKKNSLLEENRSLKIEFVNHNSFEKILSFSRMEEFEKINKVDYIEIPKAVLTKR